MKYNVLIIIKKRIGIIKRNFLILNKFRIGVIMTRIKPIKLLIKNLGYRDTLDQKSFIENFFSYFFITIITNYWIFIN